MMGRFGEGERGHGEECVRVWEFGSMGVLEGGGWGQCASFFVTGTRISVSVTSGKPL